MKNILLAAFLLHSCVQADFIRDGALEVVNDTVTKLMWQDDNASKVEKRVWTEAIDYCDGLIFAGEDDWRLPNSNELYSIADRSKRDPAIQDAFVNGLSVHYWSSTTSRKNIDNAWFVYFIDGSDSESKKISNLNVRCVRG